MIECYKPVTDLTNDEIKFIINKIFNPKAIKNIRRHKRDHYISADIVTTWNCDDEKPFDVTDELCLYEPGYSSCEIEVDFSVDADDLHMWKQFCLAKGCFYLLKDNPFL